MRDNLTNVLFVIRTLLSRGKGNQAFIGANWVVALLKVVPKRFKRHLALSLLSWSPHYFYRHVNDEYHGLPRNEFLEREFTRTKESRQKIVNLILARYLKTDQIVLDYGCGPGFLANAVSALVAKVLAVDVSIGALECARILNGQENITYLHAAQLEHVEDASIDLVYSFAVVQHVTDQVLGNILDTSYRALNNNGRIVLHVVIDQHEWRSEADWASDKTIKGRIKLKYGLNCFGRSGDAIVRMLVSHGFSSVYLQPISSLCSDDFDDICKQHLVTACKSARLNDCQAPEKS